MLPAACSPLTSGLVLGAPRRGTVRAGLREVLYVGFADGEILPVESSRGVGLPTALRLAVGLVDWGVSAGDEVVVGGGALRLPDEEIHAVRTWRPCRVWTTHARAGGSRRLATAVAGGAARLGLGPGLTPAADDELCGLLLVAYAVGVTVDLGEAPARTTDLSASLVRAAAAGYAVAPAVRVVDAGVAGRSAHATDLAAVRALGDTSGQALLDGIARGLAALHEEGRTVA